MKKKLNCLRIVGIVIILVALITIKSIAFGGDNSAASSEDVAAAYAVERIETPETKIKVPEVLKYFQELTYKTSTDKEILKTELATCKDYEFRLIKLLNNQEFADERDLVEEELVNVRGLMTKYEESIIAIEAEEARIEALWAEKSEEYPEATKVWKYMKEELGWNDYVCAGVMGNLMAEVGGQTLNIQPSLYGHSSGSYYGICQWSARYYPNIQGSGLDAQLDFLRDTVQEELNTYGYLFRSDMNYESFCALTDAEDAALAFAKAYERCGSGSYRVRQSNALKAYNYFTN